MKLASFRIHNRATWGLVEGDAVVDIGAAAGRGVPDLKSCIEQEAYELIRRQSDSAPRHSMNEVTWLPVIPNPEKIFCVGLNYETHRKETGRAVVEHPTIFARFANTQTGHLTNIVRPRVSTHLDFEGELAVIIGKAGRYIREGECIRNMSPDSHATTMAASATGSITRINSRRARISPAREALGRGW